MIAAGCMSGTSLDGIDVAIVDLEPRGDGYRMRLLDFETAAFPGDLRSRIVDALPPYASAARLLADAGAASGDSFGSALARVSGGALARLHAELGDAFGDAVVQAARGRTLDFVGSHGLTFHHDPQRRVTLQLGDAFRIRERSGATVVYDFRAADTAAGGEGAPLVPYVDALFLGDPHEDRVAVNIGGIANVTVLRAGAPADETLAFDTGPGNMLVDAFVAARTGGAQTMDDDGRLASRGVVDARLLDALRRHSYFERRPPKSTGREDFGAHYLRAHGSPLDDCSLEDGCATLAAFTATTLGDAIRVYAPANARVVLSGGGSRNPAIVAALEAAIGRATQRSDAFGLPIDAKEAIAFAVLGYETLRGRAAGMPSVTGARHAAVLGAVAPLGMRELLARVDEETHRSGKMPS